MSTRIHKSRVVVLTRESVGERDALIQVLCAQRGKHTLLARGIKHVLSKHSSSLQTGAVGYIWWTPGKRQDIVISTQTVLPLSSFSHASSVYALNTVYALVAQMIPWESPDVQLFNMLIDLVRDVRKGGLLQVEKILPAVLEYFGWTYAHDMPLPEFIEYHVNISAQALRTYEQTINYQT